MGEYTGDLKGFAEKAVGRIEEEGGKLLKDREMEAEGNQHRLSGEHQEIVAGSGERTEEALPDKTTIGNPVSDAKS